MGRVEVSSKVRFFSNILINNSGTSYSAATCIGSLITIPLALRAVNRTGMVSSVFLTDLSNNTVPMTLLFFKKAPSASIVDGSALPVSTTEMAQRFIGSININKSDYFQFGATSGSAAVVNNVGLNIESDDVTSQSIYVVAVTNAAITFASASALRLTLAIIQD